MNSTSVDPDPANRGIGPLPNTPQQTKNFNAAAASGDAANYHVLVESGLVPAVLDPDGIAAANLIQPVVSPPFDKQLIVVMEDGSKVSVTKGPPPLLSLGNDAGCQIMAALPDGSYAAITFPNPKNPQGALPQYYVSGVSSFTAKTKVILDALLSKLTNGRWGLTAIKSDLPPSTRSTTFVPGDLRARKVFEGD